MKPREFFGNSMEEALRTVRAALGPDALILDTKSVPAQSGAKVQITAMADAAAPPQHDTPQGGDGVAASGFQEVRRELQELKSFLGWWLPGVKQKKVFEELMTQGVAPEVITRVTQEMDSAGAGDERERARKVLARLISTGGDLERQAAGRTCVALIGPTGVGKTTAVVKLTARLIHQGHASVGWISLDRRIGGADLLGAYAGILGVPHEAAENAEEVSRALERLSACSVVLLDTAGVSPRDPASLDEIVETTRAVKNLRRILFLNASTNSHDMREWAQLFESVGFDSLVLTKVDECRHFGPAINVAVSSGRPLSYITQGQKPAGGLDLARAETLAAMVLP
jgi:flagellar biosynthesis protein FlhF